MDVVNSETTTVISGRFLQEEHSGDHSNLNIKEISKIIPKHSTLNFLKKAGFFFLIQNPWKMRGLDSPVIYLGKSSYPFL